MIKAIGKSNSKSRNVSSQDIDAEAIEQLTKQVNNIETKVSNIKSSLQGIMVLLQEMQKQ